MPQADPIETLGLGVAADYKAKKARGKGAAAKAGDEAASEALDAGSTAEEASDLGTVVEDKVAEVVATVENEPAPVAPPPAPGDDRESVFDRRLNRLSVLVEDAEFASGTALGDLVDVVVELFKHRPALWNAMNNGEQRDLIRHVQEVCKSVLRKVVLVVAEEDSDTIQGTFLGNFSVKGEAIEAKLKIEGVDEDVLMHAYRLAGHRVVLISADDKRFAATRREPATMPDQHDIPFADPPKPGPGAALAPAAEPPADDSDLADGADEEEGEGDTPPADGWGVFDTSRSEWLVDESGGDDGWTANSADAGRWNYDTAKHLADDFGDGGTDVVARQLGDDDPAPDEDRTHDSTSAIND